MVRELFIVVLLMILISVVYTVNMSEAMTDESGDRKVKFNRRVKVRGFKKSTREIMDDSSQSL